MKTRPYTIIPTRTYMRRNRTHTSVITLMQRCRVMECVCHATRTITFVALPKFATLQIASAR